MHQSIESHTDWLYPSHRTLHAGLQKKFAEGFFSQRHHVPLFGGFIVVETVGVSGLSHSQTADLSLLIDSNQATLTIADFRQEHTSDSLQIRGITTNTKLDRNGIIVESPDVLLDGMSFEVSKGSEYEVRGILPGNQTCELEYTNHSVIYAVMDICGSIIAG